MNIHITHIDNLDIDMQEYQVDYDMHSKDGKYEILKHPVFDVDVAKIPRRYDSIIYGGKIYFVINALHNMDTISSASKLRVDDGAGIVVHVDDNPPKGE